MRSGQTCSAGRPRQVRWRMERCAIIYWSSTTQAMSEEQLKVFWEAIQADTGLRQKLQGVTEPDAVAAIAKEAGFMITTEELQRAQAEISEAGLDWILGLGDWVWLGILGFSSSGLLGLGALEKRLLLWEEEGEGEG